MNLKKNPEFIPLIDWWEKDGKSMVLWLAVFLAAFGGWKYWQHHRAAVKTAASDALVSAFTTEEIEEASAKFSGEKAGGVLKLRLAKSYFDAGRYEEALAAYESLDGKSVEGFADIPTVGKAQCQEALGKFAEAQQAFDAFVEQNPTNYLTLTAQLGAARCLAEQGNEAEALKRLDALKDANKDDELAKARVEATETAVKRFARK